MKYRRLYGLLAMMSAIGGLWACSKDDSGTETASTGRPEFVVKTFDLYENETALSPMNIVSDGRTVRYDGTNGSGWIWTVVDPSVAEAASDGRLTGLKSGSSRFSVKSADGTRAAYQTVNVLAADPMKRALTREMIYSKGQMLKTNSVMQSFDLCEDGTMFCAQVGAGKTNHCIYVCKTRPEAPAIENSMALKYFGHASTVVAEMDGGDYYIWIGSYGTRTNATTDFSYRYSQTVARLKYAAGREYLPADCAEHYWIPERRNIHPALDVGNDQVAFWCLDSGSRQYIYVYRLSEVRALAPKTVQLSFSITTGAGNTSEPEESGKPTATVRDLSELTPVAMIVLPKGGAVGSVNMQGIELKNGRVYYYEGEGNDNNGAEASTAWVSLMDFNGTLAWREPVAAIADMGILSSFGLTATGYMEPESLKLKNGTLYLGFASKSSDDIRRVAILQYPLVDVD